MLQALPKHRQATFQRRPLGGLNIPAQTFPVPYHLAVCPVQPSTTPVT